MNLILPIFFILSSVAIFFGYVDPNYRGSDSGVVDTLEEVDYSKFSILDLQNEYKTYSAISSSSDTIIQNRNALIAKRATISLEEENKLEKLLPSNIDNIRLIIEITEIAEKRNLHIKNISITDDSKRSSNSVDTTVSSYNTLGLKFSVNSTYDEFLLLLNDLANNLRILDITDISFTANDNGFYDFNVGLKTYWIKSLDK